MAEPKKKELIINKFQNPNDLFPALGIIVSGGTTKFVKVKSIGDYEIVGETQDDAMGEAFDKAGRMLGLGYPAGPLIEKLASNGQSTLELPVPMRGVKSADTSFSGLKTAVQRLIEERKDTDGHLSRQLICDIALAFQTSCVKHLTEKVKFALNQGEYRTLIVAGGVASNLVVRRELRRVASDHQLKLLVPYTKKLCVDNAAMIAVAGFYQVSRNDFIKDFANLDRLPNMPIGSASHQ